jgi:hypothetical protein
VKKFSIVVILTLCLLFSFTSLASAELLFGVSAETGSSDFSVDYKGDYATTYHAANVDDISELPDMITLTGDLNLFLVRIGAEYGYGDVGDGATFSTATIKAGWDIALPVFTFQLYGGYQAFTITHGDTVSSLELGDSAYWDLFASIGVKASLANVSVFANANVPLYGKFDNGVDEDDNASISCLKAGISYAPLPFVDLFVDYRKMDAESKVMKLASEGYNFGVKLSF